MDYVSYIRGMVGHEPVFMPAACMVIHNEKGEILLQQRTDCGKWGLSGGICELDESVAETAHRELMEETGLTAEIEYLIGIYSKPMIELKNGDKLQPVTVAFAAHVTGGEMKESCDETLALAWFPKDSLPEIYSAKHKEIISDYFMGKSGVYK